MRYLTCNKKGCGRTFEGNLALSIHQGRKHKNGSVNGGSRQNNLTPPMVATVPLLALADEASTIGAIATMLDSLSVVGLGYVTIRAQTRFTELRNNQGGTSE